MTARDRRQPPLRVLLADDDDLYALSVAVSLQAYGWIDVVGRARDGAEAVDLALRLHPDVVLMDGRMPRLDGYEATRRLLAEEPRSCVLMVTSSSDTCDRRRSREAGAAAFVLKADGHDAIADALAQVVGVGDVVR